MDLIAHIGKCVKEELASKQLPDLEDLQLIIHGWQTASKIIRNDTDLNHQLLEDPNEPDDEDWLALPSNSSPIDLVGDDDGDTIAHIDEASTQPTKDTTSSSADIQTSVSSDRMHKAHELWGGYVVHLTNSLFQLIVLVSRSYPACWMQRLKLLESFLVVTISN